MVIAGRVAAHAGCTVTTGVASASEPPSSWPTSTRGYDSQY